MERNTNKETYDAVHSPKHYTLPGLSVESVDVVESLLKATGFTGVPAWHYGNALKYLFRLGRKGEAQEDLNKALKYLGWLQESLEQEEEDASV